MRVFLQPYLLTFLCFEVWFGVPIFSRLRSTKTRKRKIRMRNKGQQRPGPPPQLTTTTTTTNLNTHITTQDFPPKSRASGQPLNSTMSLFEPSKNGHLYCFYSTERFSPVLKFWVVCLSYFFWGRLKKDNQHIASWWFQPIWKNISQISPGRGENKTYLITTQEIS